MPSEKSLAGNSHHSEPLEVADKDIEKGVADSRSQHSNLDGESEAAQENVDQSLPSNGISNAATAGTLERFETLQPIVTARDWNGADDPLNPQNWSGRKKAWHTVQPALFAFAVFVTTRSDLL